MATQEQVLKNKENNIKKIFELLKENKTMSSKKLAAEIGINESTLKNYLLVLTKDNLIKFKRSQARYSQPNMYYLPENLDSLMVIQRRLLNLENEKIINCKKEIIEVLHKFPSGRLAFLLSVLSGFTAKQVNQSVAELMQEGMIESFNNSARGNVSLAYKIKLQEAA